MSGWSKELASIWTNNVPPSRPSIEELCVYTKLLRQIQKNQSTPVKMLVLGSTPEFRDWGYEENLAVYIVDKSKSYYRKITRELRHKNTNEEVFVQNWEDMHFSEKFDLIIGDLSIGNINPPEFDKFLDNISAALSPNGLFIGKSFFWTENATILTPLEIINRYASFRHIHPYTFINHQLGLFCLDKQNSLIDFSKMFQEITKLHETNVIDSKLYSFFTNVGWNTEMKFSFYAPSRKSFVNSVNSTLSLSFVKFIKTNDVYSTLFPIFVIKHK